MDTRIPASAGYDADEANDPLEALALLVPHAAGWEQRSSGTAEYAAIAERVAGALAALRPAVSDAVRAKYAQQPVSDALRADVVGTAGGNAIAAATGLRAWLRGYEESQWVRSALRDARAVASADAVVARLHEYEAQARGAILARFRAPAG